MKFWIFLVLFLTTSFQVERIKKIHGKDFYSSGSETVNTLVLRANKFSKIRVDEIYADRIFLVQSLNAAENELNMEAVRKTNPNNTMKYYFELDISNLKKGNYLICSYACYWAGRLELIVF
jgi:hypothetical protein